MKSFIFGIFILLVSATLLHANEDKAVKEALLKYNYGIIKMAKSGETAFFKSFVKEDIVTKMMLWVKSWQDNNLVMLAEIKDFRFGPITYGEHNASITTMENWNFTYVDISTRKVAADTITMLYKMRYTLKKQENGWMIVDIKHLDEKQFITPEAQKTLPGRAEEKTLQGFVPSYPQKKIATH